MPAVGQVWQVMHRAAGDVGEHPVSTSGFFGAAEEWPEPAVAVGGRGALCVRPAWRACGVACRVGESLDVDEPTLSETGTCRLGDQAVLSLLSQRSLALCAHGVTAYDSQPPRTLCSGCSGGARLGCSGGCEGVLIPRGCALVGP